MKLKWQWFLGGRHMFWVSIALLFIFICGILTTYVIDPTNIYIKVKNTANEGLIKTISEEYIRSLGIKIKKPIHYRFVEYTQQKNLLGTFHEWNGAYYIDVSSETNVDFYDTVVHETRHMIVQELKNEKIINLSKYTEEIAQGKNGIYNELFNCGVKLLKEKYKGAIR